MKKNYNIKSIIKTTILILLLVYIVYTFIGIFISAPNQIYKDKEISITEKIKKDNKKIIDVERFSFKYVTYTATTKKSYIIYDHNGKKIATRKKSEAQFDKVKEIINKKYPALKDSEIKIGYGKKNIAYVIEDGYTWLVLDFDTLKEVFYMKEGE